jgi:integrase
LDDLKNWLLAIPDFRTRINCHTKGSQLYNYAKRHKWVDENLFEQIDRPKVDEKPAQIFTVEQAHNLLIAAKDLGIVPYIAVGLFAGVRMEEMCRLKGKHLNFDNKTIVLDGDVAKLRAQRTITMQPALLAWLAPYKNELKDDYRIAEDNKVTRTRKALLEAAQLKKWTDNGLRHSFGSYHLAKFRKVDDTAHDMGNSVAMVHRHYKALVLKSEAAKYWNLRP